MVLLEDAGALIGLLFALIGVGLTLLTGNAVWDGIGSVGIGALLGVIAVILMVEMHSLLIGEGATPEQVDKNAYCQPIARERCPRDMPARRPAGWTAIHFVLPRRTIEGLTLFNQVYGCSRTSRTLRGTTRLPEAVPKN